MTRRTTSVRTRQVALLVAFVSAACAHSKAGGEAAPMTLASGTHAAEDPAAGEPEGANAVDGAGPERERAALAALDRMGEYLRSLTAFAVRAEATTDEILDMGQKVQFEGTIELWVRRPDRLRASIESDRKRRDHFYDGNTFTLYSPRTGFYAQFVAPKTILALLDIAEQRYGIEMPLVDLFRWGADDAARVRSAIDLGESRVAGVATDHYAYRAEDVDFQVWIARGERPLPIKLVITTTSEPAQPQYAVTFAWNLDVALSEKDFAFVPPEGASRIVFDVRKP